MGVPKFHGGKGRKGRRRLHLYLRSVALTACVKCAKPMRPHTACLHCGFYKGREVIDTLKKVKKKAKKESHQKT